jgi:hypothetical protein
VSSGGAGIAPSMILRNTNEKDKRKVQEGLCGGADNALGVSSTGQEEKRSAPSRAMLPPRKSLQRRLGEDRNS